MHDLGRILEFWYNHDRPAAARCASIFFTMNRLVSRKRSTQFARHELSEREKLVDGVPVTHLSQHMLVNV